MQIIFDTNRDNSDDARIMREMLDVYIARVQSATKDWHAEPSPTSTHAHVSGSKGAIIPLPTPVLDGPEHVATSFTPGNLGAPSPADAAPVPTAPEVSTAGVPVPPIAASVPAPPSTAPEVPAAPTTSAATDDLDVKGLPWDERIHAGTKAKNADGSWRQRRGLNDPALVARVEAEMRNTPQATAEHAADKQEPAGWTTPAAAVPPPPVTTVATPPAPAAPDALTYDGFLSWVTPKMMDGSTPFDKVAAALSASGVSSLQELRDSPAAIPAVYAALGGV